MPKGMFLKSEGRASNLSAPGGHTLAQYCADRGIRYGDTGEPVSLEVFTQYALAFQRDLVPSVEEVMVAQVEHSSEGFHLTLANGERARARHVIIATGLDHAAYVPPELHGLPSELLSHSSDHSDLSGFRWKEVVVIGGGQSAIESAALLFEEGAFVQLLVRAPSLLWNSGPRNSPPSLYQRVRTPPSALGSGLQLWAYANAPQLFRYLPQAARFDRVKNVLGPAGAWWLKERVVGRIPVLLRHSVFKAKVQGGRAILEAAGSDGKIRPITADHVFAATGYRFTLDRLPFLSPDLKSLVRVEAGKPVLSSYLESSVPGLYFTSLASANSFGPAMRFLHGADYTARRISRRIAGQQRHAEKWRIQPQTTQKASDVSAASHGNEVRYDRSRSHI